MNIPSVPPHPLIVPDSGNLHPAWRGYFDQLTMLLQQNLSNEGYKIPQQTTANVTALNTAKSTGALLYDSDTDELKVNINGTFKTVQVV
jgi:hypothetical protein